MDNIDYIKLNKYIDENIINILSKNNNLNNKIDLIYYKYLTLSEKKKIIVLKNLIKLNIILQSKNLFIQNYINKNDHNIINK